MWNCNSLGPTNKKTSKNLQEYWLNATWMLSGSCPVAIWQPWLQECSWNTVPMCSKSNVNAAVQMPPRCCQSAVQIQSACLQNVNAIQPPSCHQIQRQPKHPLNTLSVHTLYISDQPIECSFQCGEGAMGNWLVVNAGNCPTPPRPGSLVAPR